MVENSISRSLSSTDWLPPGDLRPAVPSSAQMTWLPVPILELRAVNIFKRLVGILETVVDKNSFPVLWDRGESDK